jgi:hypothetical protein
MAAWTIKDRSGRLLAAFIAGTRREVGRKIVPQRYDPFRLEVSPSYRRLFDYTLAAILNREGWKIVRIPSKASSGIASGRLVTQDAVSAGQAHAKS